MHELLMKVAGIRLKICLTKVFVLRSMGNELVPPLLQYIARGGSSSSGKGVHMYKVC